MSTAIVADTTTMEYPSSNIQCQTRLPARQVKFDVPMTNSKVGHWSFVIYLTFGIGYWDFLFILGIGVSL